MTTKPSQTGGKVGGATPVASPASQSKASTKQNKASSRKSNDAHDKRPYHADKIAHGEPGIKGKWSAWPDIGE